MRRFVLNRQDDPTGVSGTGIVAEGVQFTDRTVVVRWLTTTRSTVFYDSIADAITIHGHGGATVVEWLDGRQPKPDDSCAACGYWRSSGRHGPVDECPGQLDPDHDPWDHHDFAEVERE